MDALFASGRVIDLILLFMVGEAVLVAVLHARGHFRVALPALLPNLLAGAFLLLALRSALTGGATSSVSLWLLLGLGGHLADLAVRRGGGRR